MENTFGSERTTNKRCTAYLEVKYLGVPKATQKVTMEKEIIK